jgi:hypothetical protein
MAVSVGAAQLRPIPGAGIAAAHIAREFARFGAKLPGAASFAGAKSSRIILRRLAAGLHPLAQRARDCYEHATDGGTLPASSEF